MAKRRTVQKANFGEIASNAARMVGRLSEEGGLAGRVGRGLSGASQKIRGLGEGIKEFGQKVRRGVADVNPFNNNAVITPTTPTITRTPEEYLRRNIYDMQANGIGRRVGSLIAGANPFGDEAMSASFRQGLMGTPEEYARRIAPPPKKSRKTTYGQELQAPLEEKHFFDPFLSYAENLTPEFKAIMEQDPYFSTPNMSATTPKITERGLNPNWRNNSDPYWQAQEIADNAWRDVYEPTNQRVSRGNITQRPRSKPGEYSPTKQGYRRFNEIIAEAKANPPLPREPLSYNPFLYEGVKSFDSTQYERPIMNRNEDLERYNAQLDWMRRLNPNRHDETNKMYAIAQPSIDATKFLSPEEIKDIIFGHLKDNYPGRSDDWYYNAAASSYPQYADAIKFAPEPFAPKPRGRKTGLNSNWADLNGGMGKSMGKRDTINKFMDNSFAKSMSKPTSTNRSIKSSNKYFN